MYNANISGTLIHGDPRPENLFFNPLTFIDFQLAMETPPEHDLMWICMYGFESKYRRTHEIDLLFHYHAELGKRGIILLHTLESTPFILEMKRLCLPSK